jgi:hypothetical protein
VDAKFGSESGFLWAFVSFSNVSNHKVVAAKGFSMADTKLHCSEVALASPASSRSLTVEVDQLAGPCRLDSPGKYVAVSPKGVNIPIPKELFIALSDFIKTRKCPGSITIQFRSGEILCLESVAKKTYRSNT